MSVCYQVSVSPCTHPPGISSWLIGAMGRTIVSAFIVRVVGRFGRLLPHSSIEGGLRLPTHWGLASLGAPRYE